MNRPSSILRLIIGVCVLLVVGCNSDGSDSDGQAESYTVGGSVSGLLDTLVLDINGSDTLTLTADGSFTFSDAFPTGSSYAVTVQSQPSAQTCAVGNGSGAITSADVTNITVNCSTNTRAVGGTVSGLDLSESVVLQNNGADDLTITGDGAFSFSSPVDQGSSYDVTILTQPVTQTCAVTNGSGTAGLSDITNVLVTCSTNTYAIGGAVTGLSGTVVLQNNGANDLTINSDGAFSFSIPVAQDSIYNVTVMTQPDTQTCTVTNGSGTVGGADVSNVGIDCAYDATTLATSVGNLALSVTGLVEYGISGTPSSGAARTITVTNTGSNAAFNVSVTLPTWPAGTTSTTTCGDTLAAGASCSITITPGDTATSDGIIPCSSGTAPVPGVIQVATGNAGTVSTNVLVLSYGCIYQGGYVYAFDDATPNTESVGGKVVATTDQAGPGVIWSSNGNGGSVGDVANDAIYGIAETSTTSLPNPGSGQVAGQTACNGAADGACDTNNIYVYYQNNAAGAPVNLSYYAAGLCKQTISGYSDWYLPAICEMGYDAGVSGSGCGTSGVPTLQNMQSSLVDFNGLDLLAGENWSSTEFSGVPQSGAWDQYFASGGGSFHVGAAKFSDLGVRCSRSLTP